MVALAENLERWRSGDQLKTECLRETEDREDRQTFWDVDSEGVCVWLLLVPPQAWSLPEAQRLLINQRHLVSWILVPTSSCFLVRWTAS